MLPQATVQQGFQVSPLKRLFMAPRLRFWSSEWRPENDHHQTSLSL